jgi:hypothetical protein
MATSPTNDSASEGVEHLQRAAQEMILAARKFLDAAEDVVQDSDRFSALAGGVSDLVGTLTSALRPDTPAPRDPERKPPRVRKIAVDE